MITAAFESASVGVDGSTIEEVAWARNSFPVFYSVNGIFGDPKARVITLKRRSKKRLAAVAVRFEMGWYDRKVRWVRDLSCGDTRIFLELEVRRVDCRRCSKVKRERLDFLADNPLYTKRFAYFVGRRCRGATIKEVAEELALDWHTVKALAAGSVTAG